MKAGDNGTALPLDHFFRHASGRLVSALSRVFGLGRLDLVEDVVQDALLEAVQTWTLSGAPEDPPAWLYRVARNRALDAIRRERTSDRLAPELARRLEEVRRQQAVESGFAGELADDQLALMFACCHPALSKTSQIALTLRLLCGLTTREIAHALLSNEVAAQRRIARARSELARAGRLEIPSGGALQPRLGAVQQTLYLLFNEGYCSRHPDELVRRDLCGEAMRLGELLLEHPGCDTPTSSALLALFHLHMARFGTRQDQAGRLLLLESQDRGSWDRTAVARGLALLEVSGRGERLSRYHLEAGIAAHHCVAAAARDVDWRAILGLYDQLLELHPSPVVELNRAVALAQVDGPQAAIPVIEAIAATGRLQGYHLLHAVLGELCLRAGRLEQAGGHLRRAIAATVSSPEQELLRDRLARCGGGAGSQEPHEEERWERKVRVRPRPQPRWPTAR